MRVQVPSTHLVRLWVYVYPWRLYEKLSPRAVEALGLDPSKGVTVRCKPCVINIVQYAYCCTKTFASVVVAAVVRCGASLPGTAP